MASYIIHQPEAVKESAYQDHLDFYCKAWAKDSIYSKFIENGISGWPMRNKLSQDVKDY